MASQGGLGRQKVPPEPTFAFGCHLGNDSGNLSMGKQRQFTQGQQIMLHAFKIEKVIYIEKMFPYISF